MAGACRLSDGTNITITGTGSTADPYVINSSGGGGGGVGTLTGGYAEVMTSQVAISTEVDLIGLTVTVTVASGQRIKITACVSISGDDQNGFGVRIKEGTTVLQDGTITLAAASLQDTLMFSWVGTPTAGVHTYKLSMRRFSGASDGAMFAAADTPAFILVEGIGV